MIERYCSRDISGWLKGTLASIDYHKIRILSGYCPLKWTLGSYAEQDDPKTVVIVDLLISSSDWYKHLYQLIITRSYPEEDNVGVVAGLLILFAVWYRVSLKKRSLVIPALLEALGCSKGMNISQKHCQSSFFGWLHYFLPNCPF